MIDISNWDLRWRGYPVTVVSEGVAELLGGWTASAVGDLLSRAVDTAEPGEPADWMFESELGGTKIWIERFGGVRNFTTGKHEDGQWSVYLPSER